jgi:hypothetical protein
MSQPNIQPSNRIAAAQNYSATGERFEVAGMANQNTRNIG